MKQHVLFLALLFSSFISFAQPTITSIDPLKARVDSIVTITGTNYVANKDSNVVYFGPVKGEVVTATSTQIRVKVPLGAGHDPLSVTTRGLTATGNIPFNVLFPAQGVLGLGSFPTKIDSATSDKPYSVISADLDIDGKPDVILGHAHNSTFLGFTIFRNTSEQNIFSLGSRQIFSTGNKHNRIYAADIDGDGKKDLVMPNHNSQSFSVYRNISTIGNISFAPRVNVQIYTGATPFYAQISDLDGDGKLDVITTNYPLNGFQIFRNISSIGTIAFEAAVDYSTQGTYPTDIAVGDLNNDGKKDIVIGNSQNYTVGVYQNVSSVGNLLFAAPRNYDVTMGVHALNIADLNNDGKLDIIASDFSNSGSSIYSNTISILQNNTNIGASFNSYSFNPKVTYIVGSGSLDLKVNDLNGDGKTDILVGNYQSSYISLLVNNSVQNNNISLNSSINIQSGNSAAFVESSDLNLDGKPDIIVSNNASNTVSFFISNITLLSNENLINFSVKALDNSALLQWELIDKNNVEKIIIEHSLNGYYFNEIFSTDNVIKSQQYCHSYNNESNNFYRLIQISKSGKKSYSDIKMLSNKLTISSGINLYPNPTFNEVYLNSNYEIQKLLIFNNTGRQVAFYNCNNVKSYYLNLSKLPRGLYYIKVFNKYGDSEVKKMLLK